MINPIEEFKLKYGLIQHGNTSYLEHCFGIYNILKNELNCDEHVCLAGLYHSVYGTEYFNTDIKLSPPQLLQLIGVSAEKLVSLFCYAKDRTNTILNNNLRLDEKTRYELLCIEYANLKEQSMRLNDNNLHDICRLLLNEISLCKNYKRSFEKININDRSVFVYDDILDESEIEKLNLFCLSSNYTPNHSSNNLNYDLDCRFVSNIDSEKIVETGLIKLLKPIAEFSNLKLDIYNAYVNHYSIGTPVSKHTDSSDTGTYTILVFCNKFWENIWGGEIKFYNERSEIHSVIDYKPGRVIVFDSRISHQVMPLTHVAKKDRYSIALKCKLNEMRS